MRSPICVKCTLARNKLVALTREDQSEPGLVAAYLDTNIVSDGLLSIESLQRSSFSQLVSELKERGYIVKLPIEVLPELGSNLREIKSKAKRLRSLGVTLAKVNQPPLHYMKLHNEYVEVFSSPGLEFEYHEFLGARNAQANLAFIPVGPLLIWNPNPKDGEVQFETKSSSILKDIGQKENHSLRDWLIAREAATSWNPTMSICNLLITADRALVASIEGTFSGKLKVALAIRRGDKIHPRDCDYS